MKKQLCLILAIINLTALAQVNLSLSLTACYALNGNGSEPVSSSTGTLGAVTPTVNRFNTAGSALAFSGSTASYVELPDNLNTKPTNAISISCWIKTPVMNDAYICVTKNSLFSNFEAFNLCIEPSLKFMTRKCGPNGTNMVLSATSLSLNTWFHLVTTIDNASVKLYVNGVLEGTTASTFNGFDYVSGKKVYLGSSHEPSYDAPFTGSIDNVRFYNRTLSAGEVSALYTQDPSCTAGQVPVSNFITSNTLICTNAGISFIDQSSNNPASWSWQFPGGLPAVSTLSNPVVTFSSTGVKTISLTATNSFGAGAMITRTIQVQACTALGEQAGNSERLLVYPNPGTGKFSVDVTNVDLRSYSVTDALGRVVLTANQVNSAHLEIDLDNDARGIYYLRLVTAKGHITSKIVKE